LENKLFQLVIFLHTFEINKLGIQKHGRIIEKIRTVIGKTGSDYRRVVQAFTPAGLAHD
jgi:predicted RNA-binding protein YlqC (UPF0109 family)